jgi:hypothetical protein
MSILDCIIKAPMRWRPLEWWVWPSAMFAQFTTPIGIVRGDLELWSGSVRGGESSARAATCGTAR